MARCPGSACGRAELGPEATIGAKARASAPLRYSSSSNCRATSRSRAPGRSTASSCAKAASLTAQARAMASTSAASFARPQRRDRAGCRLQGRVRQPIPQLVPQRHREPGRLERQPPHPGILQRLRQRLGSRPAMAPDAPARALLRRPLHVAHVGQQQRPPHRDDRVGRGAGEPGQVAQVVVFQRLLAHQQQTVHLVLSVQPRPHPRQPQIRLRPHPDYAALRHPIHTACLSGTYQQSRIVADSVAAIEAFCEFGARQPPKPHQAAAPQEIPASRRSTTRAPASVRINSMGVLPSRALRLRCNQRPAFS